MRSSPSLVTLVLILAAIQNVVGHEKTLRKMVRDRHKMVQKPFSGSGLVNRAIYNTKIDPEITQTKVSMQKYILDDPILTPEGNTTNLGVVLDRNIENDIKPRQIKSGYEFNGATNRIVFNNDNIKRSNEITSGLNIHTPSSQFFPNVEKLFNDPDPVIDDGYLAITAHKDFTEETGKIRNLFGIELANALIPQNNSFYSNSAKHRKIQQDMMIKAKKENKIDLTTESLYNDSKKISDLDACINILQSEADIDAQVLFSNLDIEPTWAKNKKYWNKQFEDRYETLMKSSKWPSLQVILMPFTQVDAFSKVPLHPLHAHNIITNAVKKLLLYKNLTFTWNEVSHFSQWWKTANQKSRGAILQLIQEERFEITTGGWVEIEEATSYIFGMVHQLTEGHQWLKNNLNYTPKVAWLTKSVTHSPTVPFIFSASGIPQMVITNIHFSIEHYLAENQYSDFVWNQNWDVNKLENNTAYESNNIRNSRYGEHSILTHYLQFNSDDFGACGPETELCNREYDFENSNKDINEHNIKEKSELLLEQYSKTGTLSAHNVIIVPLGGPYRYQKAKSLTKMYNNYVKIADFINLNQDIYKSTLQFGTPKDYFAKISSIHKKYPTIKGEFNNYADINSGSPIYWTSFFRTRPFIKLLLRYLEANLRSAEILFSFAHSSNVFETYHAGNLFEQLLQVRESTARLQDKDIISGKLTAKVLQYVYGQILNTIKGCWLLQEIAVSFLSTKPGIHNKYLEKHIYRNGDFISPFKSIVAGDQLYIFNPLSIERTEVVEFLTRSPKIKVVDHNNKIVEQQINPIFQHTSQHVINISNQFYKILFIAKLSPFSFKLFKIELSRDTSNAMSTVYCDKCFVESNAGGTEDTASAFTLYAIGKGEIQIENDKHHVIIDENTGFMKTITDKTTGLIKSVVIDYGAITSSHENIQMFTFNVKSNEKIIIIISGYIVTEVISIYGNLLQHCIKIFHSSDGALKHILKVESRLGHGLSTGLKETEVFLSIQTDIRNGKAPQIFVDNNGFQYTSHLVNLSRNIESNMIALSSVAFIQDTQSRLTVITDHTQGVTSVNEGQIMVMLDKILPTEENSNDMDFVTMSHEHIILLENIIDNSDLQLPSLYANYFANAMSYPLDVFFFGHNLTHFCHYPSLRLLKSSLPCNINIINYRMLVHEQYNENLNTNTALLTLQRTSYSCNIQFYDDIACNKNSHFKFVDIFPNISEVYKTNLVGTVRMPQTDSIDLFNLKPLELMTLKVKY